jgi:uncharacterized protein
MIAIFIFIFFSQGELSRLPQKTIAFNNGKTLKVEMALSPVQKEKGLMWRKHLPEGEGMLFKFEPPQRLSFWMKNTLIPLSIGFFREDRSLIEILDMEPAHGPVREELLPRYMSTEPAMYAIEVPVGWFKKNKINPGMKFQIR